MEKLFVFIVFLLCFILCIEVSKSEQAVVIFRCDDLYGCGQKSEVYYKNKNDCINNNFVISKLDINYISTGFQIARSSKLS